LAVIELGREQIGQGLPRPPDGFAALIEPGEIEPEVIAIGVDGNRQGQEDPCLEPVAELLGQAGHLGSAAPRLVPRVQLLVSRHDPLDCGFLATKLGGAVRPAAAHRDLS
jgi:hypothetical protein